MQLVQEAPRAAGGSDVVRSESRTFLLLRFDAAGLVEGYEVERGGDARGRGGEV